MWGYLGCGWVKGRPIFPVSGWYKTKMEKKKQKSTPKYANSTFGLQPQNLILDLTLLILSVWASECRNNKKNKGAKSQGKGSQPRTLTPSSKIEQKEGGHSLAPAKKLIPIKTEKERKNFRPRVPTFPAMPTTHTEEIWSHYGEKRGKFIIYLLRVPYC